MRVATAALLSAIGPATLARAEANYRPKYESLLKTQGSNT